MSGEKLQDVVFMPGLYISMFLFPLTRSCLHVSLKAVQ